MKLHSVTLGVALLVSATAMAQERPPRAGEMPAPDANVATASTPAQDAAAPKRAGRLDNPLDPNRPSQSSREPAKIRPAEHGAVPAENTKRPRKRADAKARDAARTGGTAEPAKIRPAEQAVTPAENTDKAADKAADKATDKPKDKASDKEANAAAPADKQAKRTAERRAVPLVVGTMPAAAPAATYGPRLNTQQGITANAPTNLPTTAIAPTRQVVPTGPAIVNSCDAGGCVDTNGVRYNGAVGSTMIGPQGQACRHNGVTMQC